jgi:predicted nucleotidyltransferase
MLPMRRDDALAILKNQAPELRQLGVVSASLFGSTARDQAAGNSDVDVAVTLADHIRGLHAFGALDRIKQQLALALKAPVDVVPEPAEPGPLKTAIDRDRCLAF